MGNDDVVSLLMNYINTKNLKVGDQLPSTIALAKEFNATPSKVRTALISLASIGLIDIRPRSGSFVKALDICIVERMFGIILNQGLSDESPSLLDVYEFKTMVDIEIFQRAAKLRTDTDLYQMHTIINRQNDCLENTSEFITSDEEYHKFVAKITRNPLYVMIIDVLQAMLRPDRLKNEKFTIEFKKEIINDHMRLFQAVKAKDITQSGELSKKHSNKRKIELIHSI